MFEVVVAPCEADQLLCAFGAHRDDEASLVSELCKQRLGHGQWCRGNQDTVEGLLGLPARGAIAMLEHHVLDA